MVPLFYKTCWIKQFRATASSYCVFLSSTWKKNTVKSAFISFVNEVISKKDHVASKPRNLSSVSILCPSCSTLYVMLCPFSHADVKWVGFNLRSSLCCHHLLVYFSAISRLGWAWIQTTAFTIHYIPALLEEGSLEGHQLQMFSILFTYYQERQVFLWVLFWFFVSWKSFS